MIFNGGNKAAVNVVYKLTVIKRYNDKKIPFFKV